VYFDDGLRRRRLPEPLSGSVVASKRDRGARQSAFDDGVRLERRLYLQSPAATAGL